LAGTTQHTRAIMVQAAVACGRGAAPDEELDGRAVHAHSGH